MIEVITEDKDLTADDTAILCTDEDEMDTALFPLEVEENAPKTSTSRPTTPMDVNPKSAGKRRKPRDEVSEQIIKYLDAKNKKPETGKSEEEVFALSVVPTLKRMTDQQKGLAKLRIQKVLYDIEFDTDN